ncbi:universal stress protein [Microvirga puerhi]|uniref:Universal stress protein n=1 Tax=Microvirga puerhi TaxID=2876078 RepID=A0ABS7VQ42_9HYPH|nr:universal stress protein [Microvirga puerhi]MBZ6077190.1 universal stress protein [Microvirga puerhi]
MIKDILVHLDGSTDDELRLAHAEAIASANQAHVTGLFTNVLPDIASLTPMDGASVAGVVAELEDDARRSGDRIEQRLAERFSRLAMPNNIRRLDGTPGQLVGQVVSEARRSDLFVATRPYDSNGSAQWDDLFEAVLFGGGRSIYVVPPGRQPSDSVRRILVAWRDSRETARAIGEAAPLIEKAVRTRVLVVDPPMASDGTPALDIEIAQHLDRYGTKVEVDLVASEGRAVSDVILDQARRMSADLIVMGGYGHSRARQWILGGTSRDMLEHGDCPVLMAH